MRAHRTLMALLVVGAALGHAAAPASAQPAAHVLSAEYKGSYTYRIDDGGPNGSVLQIRTLSWDMTIYDDGHNQRKSLVAQGSATTSYSVGGGDYCTVRQRTGSIEGPFTIGLGNDAHHVRVGTFIPPDVGSASNMIVSGGSCNGLDGTGGVLLSTVEADGSMGTGNPCYAFAKAPQFITPRTDDLRLDATKKFDKEQSSYRAPGCATNSVITATRSIHATLRVGAGGAAESDPDRDGPTPAEAQKAFATSDLLTSLLRAQLPCGYLGLGLGTALWSATVGGPTAPAALVPAQVLISAGAPLCAVYAKRIADDVTIANDPPVGNVNTIATPKPTPSSADAATQLASCDAQPAAQQAFCAELRAAAADEIAAAQKVAAVADALLATVDRETKARKTHKASALKRQGKAGDRLVTQMTAADVAEDATWRKIGSLLSAQGLTGAFTAPQSQTAIDTLLQQLKADGVSAAAVKRLAAGALVAAPVDLLAS
jgi:hypothetical protein